MSRLVRIALIAAGMALGYNLARLLIEYFRERRHTDVFSAERADDLLNPLRVVVMPASKPLRRFDLQEGQTVLELGPGPGYYTIEASRIVGPDGRLLCVDLQRGMIERLAARLAEAGADANVHVLVGNAMRLPLRSGTVDRAFLVTVLGEISDPADALAELQRVLARDGILAIDETMRDSDYVRLRRLRALCAETGLVLTSHHRSPLGYTVCFRAG